MSGARILKSAGNVGAGHAPQSFDGRAFRRALGGFATGVTVVTARSADGVRVGMTVSSFNSVSLEPPLVLWSISRSSPSFPVFREVEFWCVNVLAADQAALSNHFATPSADKFAGLDFDEGLGGAPVLEGTVARFECRSYRHYDGGDHLIMVGQVERFERWERPPLVFSSGAYCDIAPRS
ncbi:flavin reductase family protein [Telmatospirillum sp. J64-1]|uniref:flavin reductase family protein n=1 Tax=Telmatospirillum sp. J64-1 TaxID=2502183 RepID=UPI00115C7E36|nr:flavin reductase family protein [Telmatospirillum sp. J64-1]